MNGRTILSFMTMSLCLSPAITNAKTTAYFSPKGGCEDHVVAAIRQAKSHMDIAMYALNNEQILSELKDAKDRGVEIRILLDKTQAFGNKDETLWLRKEGFKVKIHSHNRIQHNKFAIFDDIIVETGSFNWTTPAEQVNDENCIFLDETPVIKSYQAQFDDTLWPENSESKSKASFAKLKRKQSE